MTEVVNVRFRNRGKVYFFDPNGTSPEEGQSVIVETAKGLEYGKCTKSIHEVPDENVILPLRPVVRIATPEDEELYTQNREKDKRAFEICQRKIQEHGLEMKLIDVEYSFEGTKILFFFTADGRVDFRELVKDLASVFKTRIELRQIGVRDGAKMLGGLGNCGRAFCCSTFLDDFQPVSVKMAKTQSLSLNPVKISGTCGRLMCCLKYEQEAYEDLLKDSPKPDSLVDTPMGRGVITELNLLRRTAKVKLEDPTETLLQTYPLSQLGYEIDGIYKAPEPEPKAARPESELQDNFKARPAARERRREHSLNLSSGPENSGKNEKREDRYPSQRGNQRMKSFPGKNQQRIKKRRKPNSDNSPD